ncbi:hypothetical protein BC938DRAFT_483677 [Jimgerdemannia flammicorona]|uniref:Zn(2)-C6 fungal-type domain-containing protein n=1 Tax=Jimgerdemannia flammicorona TaxID=994334 RepID=A0A433QBG7_9FUNG|nr:hypothetical protein BC938DRAFT_483677 [Jimgerdemannia flammicorona]
MSSTDSDTPQHYRSFQQVWKIKDLVRTREACMRCRKKRSKCDGKRPCQRCFRVNFECVYTTPKIVPEPEDVNKENEAEALVADVVHKVSELEHALDELGAEIVTMRRRRAVFPVANEISGIGYEYQNLPCFDEDGECKEKEDQAGSAVVPGTVRSEKPWVITLTKNSLRVQTNINQAAQLHEFLYNAGSRMVHRGPAMLSRPVGTQVMAIMLMVRWPNWQCALLPLLEKYFPKPVARPKLLTMSTMFIPFDLEEILLEVIVSQTLCCVPLYFVRLDERVFAYVTNRRPKSLHYTALCLAVGALNAQHVLSYHIDATAFGLPADFNTTEFARALARNYFARAQDILLDQVLASDASALCADTIEALQLLTKYLVDSNQPALALTYVGLAIRVATQLDYHRALHDPTSSAQIVDAADFNKALKWNLLVCTDKALRSLALPAHAVGTQLIHSVTADTRLNLLNVTVRAPPDATEAALQRFYDRLHTAKLSAITRDMFDAWWGESQRVPASDELDRFEAAFKRWAAELPPCLTMGYPHSSQKSYLLALNIQIVHHVNLVELYRPFLHLCPTTLPPGLPRRAETACSDAAVRCTRLIRMFMQEGGCLFPMSLYSMPCNAHMSLTESEDEKVAAVNRACIAAGLKMLKESREFVRGEMVFGAMAKFLEELMLAKGIDADDDEVLGEEVEFLPVKMPGVGW